MQSHKATTTTIYDHTRPPTTRTKNKQTPPSKDTEVEEEQEKTRPRPGSIFSSIAILSSAFYSSAYLVVMPVVVRLKL